jgi:hypothetical protein
MGYVEYGGDGSVKWQMRQDDGKVHADIDKKSKEDGLITVVVEGVEVRRIKLKKRPRQIQIFWDPDTRDTIPPYELQAESQP